MDTRTSNSDRPISRGERWGPKLLWLRQVVDSDAFRISFAVLVFAAALGVLRQELQGQNFDSIARAFGSVSSTALLLAAKPLWPATPALRFPSVGRWPP